MDIDSISLIIRREIEALIAVPLIKAFIKEFGRERTIGTVRKIIRSLGLKSGKVLSALAGETAWNISSKSVRVSVKALHSKLSGLKQAAPGSFLMLLNVSMPKCTDRMVWRNLDICFPVDEIMH